MAADLIADRYRLLEPLGRGSWSSVWLADDQELNRRVAVKTLTPAADPARFRHEARAVALLSHPNICTLYDFGEDERTPFIVLEYLPGGSLEESLTTGVPLADGETHRIAAGLAAGLGHAHEHGLVHRDLKPANVLFDDLRRPKIADFGIARMIDTTSVTEAGTVLGTASYISPEQAAATPAGPASDVYSFGVYLFWMLTGRLPFSSPSAMETVRMHRDEPPPPISSLPAGCARRARRCRLGGVEQGSGEPPCRWRGTRQRARTMKALYFGTYDREHPRNVNGSRRCVRPTSKSRAERAGARHGASRCPQRLAPRAADDPAAASSTS